MPTLYTLLFRFCVSVLLCKFRFGFVPYRVSVQAFFRFHFVLILSSCNGNGVLGVLTFLAPTVPAHSL